MEKPKRYLTTTMPIPEGAKWRIEDGQLIITYGEFVWGKTKRWELLTEKELEQKREERKRGR